MEQSSHGLTFDSVFPTVTAVHNQLLAAGVPDGGAHFDIEDLRPTPERWIAEALEETLAQVTSHLPTLLWDFLPDALNPRYRADLAHQEQRREKVREIVTRLRRSRAFERE